MPLAGFFVYHSLFVIVTRCLSLELLTTETFITMKHFTHYPYVCGPQTKRRARHYIRRVRARMSEHPVHTRQNPRANTGVIVVVCVGYYPDIRSVLDLEIEFCGGFCSIALVPPHKTNWVCHT